MAVRFAGSVVAVTAATLLVWALEPFAPTLSLGVLYIFAVLPVAVAWGTLLVVAGRRCEHARVQLLLPAADVHVRRFRTRPTGSRWPSTPSRPSWSASSRPGPAAARLTQSSASARRRSWRRSPGACSAASRSRPSSTGSGNRPPTVLGIARADIELGTGRRHGDDAPIPLEVDGRHVGTLYAPADADPNLGVRERFLPALAALLAVAFDRSRLEREALEAETLRRSDLVKTALLRAVSHDLRSPLTGITTAIGALRSKTLVFSDQDRRDLLDTIAVDAERLARLVGDLLDLSRLEAGGAEPDAEVWALDDLVREAVHDLAGWRAHRRRRREPARPRRRRAGRARAREPDRERLASSRRRMRRCTFAITATRREAIVRIVDQGPGLAADELERVFEPFYRGDQRRRSGAGLGLAIARGFAAANGGRVWAESRPGQGATFALALPVVEVPAELPA